jgi:hypothetical protein
MQGIYNSIFELRPACAEKMQVFNDLMAAYQGLENQNEERKKARASAIRMKPEVMVGEAASALLNAAVSELERTNNGIVILKAAVTRQWENKFEEGWEDNTKTKWVKRHFRNATVQVAAKLMNGEYRLFSMNVDETLVAENSYGNIKSHMLYSDAINPDNI